jgi:hypothetical protein
MPDAEKATEPREPPRRWLAFIAPIALTVIAIQQVVITRVERLTPWKGGGFGMFSTVDSPGHRMTRAYLLIGGREVPVVLPRGDALERRLSQLKSWPSDSRLEALATALADRSWRVDSGGTASPVDDDDAPGSLIGAAVRLEVYRLYFHPDALEAERVLLASAEKELR